jgi:hypothetical protein
MSFSGVIPVVKIVRRMLLKRAVRVQCSSGFVLAAMAFVCVMAMMFCFTSVTSDQTSLQRQSCPKKVLHSALSHRDPINRPSVSRVALPVQREKLDAWQFDLAKNSSTASVSLETVRSISGRSPPFC